MLIDGLIENTLKNSKLKKVRIKVDPSQLNIHGYEHVTSFEGYVLHEHNETVEVYIINLPTEFEPIQNVSKQFVTPTVSKTINPSYQNIKKKVLAQLDADGISPSTPSYKSIINSNNSEFLETYLKELGYDESEIKSLTTAPVNESVLDKVAANPLVKGTSRAINAYANIPKLIAGKGAILGRIGRTIRSLNPKDLIEVDRYPVPEKSVKSGDTIYITNLPFSNLKTYRKGSFTYQIQGTSTRGIYEYDRKINKIIDLDPIVVDRELDFSLDFSPLGNQNKIGTLIMDFRTVDEPTRYYSVKVKDFNNVKVLYVLNKLEQREGEVKNIILQDEVRYIVKHSLDEVASGKPLEDADKLINKISDKILAGRNKEAKLEEFDRIMLRLASLPEEEKVNLQSLLQKELRSAGLI